MRATCGALFAVVLFACVLFALALLAPVLLAPVLFGERAVSLAFLVPMLLALLS
ncbi:hypothetical protein [Fannyhessea vaginae]|uniref:hypothetical protein n=1 Tax=Fannyhessea vaginae TaxID=82135 RepID=UPI0012E3A970|nr:hypothetical protein [Fannyhessea vaginae]